MKCYEGAILSVDSTDGVYKYLVEDKGSILYVGNELPDKFKNTSILTWATRS